MKPVPQFHRTPAADHVFNRMKWKGAAMNGIIRRAMFNATADQGQRPVFWAGSNPDKTAAPRPREAKKKSGTAGASGLIAGLLFMPKSQ